VTCRRSYVRLVREMRGREFQRRAAAAFLPVPALPALGGHAAWIGRVLGDAAERVWPAGGSGERAAEVLGGAGVAKAAAAGGAVLVASATLAGGEAPTHHAELAGAAVKRSPSYCGQA